MKIDTLKNAQINNANRIVGGNTNTSIGTNISVATNTSDLPRDRNNVQNPF